MNKLALSSDKNIRINELITTFILAQDVKPTSKKQYKGSLKQYFA
jgi:hypothetical protein